MFKWLRDKLLSSEEGFNTGVDRNTNFLEYAKSFSSNSREIEEIIYALETENIRLWTIGYNDQTMSALLNLDMNCRRLFANVYGGSDFKYNSKFDSKSEDSKTKKVVSNELEELANEIYKKFHKVCDLLKKINKKTTTSQLVDLLKKNKIELDASFAQKNKDFLDMKNQIILEIGDDRCMPVVEAKDYRNPDFKKYSFRLSGTRDFSGLILMFDHENKNKDISLVDFNKAFKLSKKITSEIGSNAEELYDLIVAKGKFDDADKRI